MLTCRNTLLARPDRRERPTFAPLVGPLDDPGPRRNPGHILDAKRRLETRPRFVIHILVQLDATDADLFRRFRLRQPAAMQPARELHRAGSQRRPLRLDAAVFHDQSPSSAASSSSEALCPNNVSIDTW